MPDEEESAEPAQRRTMALIGACVTFGSVCAAVAAVAALDPSLSLVWTTGARTRSRSSETGAAVPLAMVYLNLAA